MGSGTTCEQPMKGGAIKGTAPRQRGMRGSGNLYDRLIKNHLVFTIEARVQSK